MKKNPGRKERRYEARNWRRQVGNIKAAIHNSKAHIAAMKAR